MNNQNKHKDKPNSLPLIEILLNKIGKVCLKDVLIISVQHLCTTTEILFHALFKLGLQPQNLYVLGKCYSTNPVVLRSLKESNVKAQQASSFFNSHLPFDSSFDYHIDIMLNQIIKENNLKKYQKIIALDDGGHLLEKIRCLFSPTLPIIGIEQTSSGFNRLQYANIPFPIINLARSDIKLKYESPLIIKLVLKKINDKILSKKVKIDNILLMGFGVLGQHIYKELKGKYNITAFDIHSDRSFISKNNLRSRLKEFDLVIGCTGFTSLTSDDFPYLKRPVILASISSSDREFDAHKLRQLSPVQDCHANINVDGINLLNCGFPITFDNDYDLIDSEDFQLTRGLILISVIQAMELDLKMAPNGFIELNNKLIKILMENIN